MVHLGVDLRAPLGCGGPIAGVGSGQGLPPPAADPGAQNLRPKKMFASMRPEAQETQVFQTYPKLSVNELVRLRVILQLIMIFLKLSPRGEKVASIHCLLHGHEINIEFLDIDTSAPEVEAPIDRNFR